MAKNSKSTTNANSKLLNVPESSLNFKVISKWDPTRSIDWLQVTPSPHCVPRIQRDIMEMYNNPPPGIIIEPEQTDITLIHCLLTGPSDTPYEGGFFYFVLRFPPDYPMHAPRVKIMTTGQGKVRFNPNLYKTGKVCLSILGTWDGPCWSPAQSLWSVLLSIQSLMNEKPYFNEPGLDKEITPGASKSYNKYLNHETIRVAVCDMLEGSTCDSRNMPQILRDKMEKSFPKFYDYYVSCCQKNLRIRNKKMIDLFGEDKGASNFGNLLQRLQAIKDKLDAKPPNAASGDFNYSSALPDSPALDTIDFDYYDELSDSPASDTIDFDYNDELSDSS